MHLHLSRRHFIQQLCAAAALTSPLLGLTAALPRAQLRASSLRFQFEPLVDLYFLLRTGTDRGEILPPEWRPALDRMKAAADYLPGGGGLDVLNGLIAESGSVAELSRVVAGMPSTVAGRAPVREALEAVADALGMAQPLYAQGIGATRRELVMEATAQRIDRVLVPGERECLTYILSGLELPDRDFEVPVFLVANAPEPGSITGRSRRLTTACFVSVGAYPGSTLLEVILHEATHALEVAAGPDSGSVLDRLRAGLQAQGVKATDPLMRDVPHTLMFVHSGETVRRALDPTHIDYGDSQGYYAKVPDVASVVRTHWMDQLNGQLSTNMAIDRMVAGVLKQAG